MTVAAGATALQAIFVLPYLWRRAVVRDWQLKWYSMWRGPFLLKRPPPPRPPPGSNGLNIKDYYEGHLTLEELNCIRASEDLLRSIQSSQLPADAEKADSRPQQPQPLQRPERIG